MFNAVLIIEISEGGNFFRKSRLMDIKVNTAEYYVMHKDIQVCVLFLNRETGAIIHVDILDPKRAPVCVKDAKSFANWWDRRSVPEYQAGKETFLENSSRLEYLMRNLGLSLNDHYWICPVDRGYTWRDVSLYENDFAEIDYVVKDLAVTVPFRPSASTQGELQKRWAVRDGERYLIKGNHGSMCRQSINEVFATELHELQQRPHTAYELVSLTAGMGQGIGCMSKNFTDSETEFIPCYDVVLMEPQRNDRSVYEHYIQICAHNGLAESELREYLDYQILSDFLLTNTDRHLLNMGILRDSDSLRFLGPAPVFDTGNSMFYEQDYSEERVHDIRINSFAKTELRMLEYVKNKNAVDLSRIPGMKLIEELYGKDKYSAVYLDNLKRGYEKKTEMLDAFGQGYSLNPRSEHYYGKRI